MFLRGRWRIQKRDQLDQMSLEVFYGGTTWILKPETVATIAHYASIFEDVPELTTLIDGLLLVDFLATAKAYFWFALLVWAFLAIGITSGLVLLALLISHGPSLVRPILHGRTIKKNSKEFRHALIIYFTSHRVFVYRAFGPIFRFAVFWAIVFTAAPRAAIFLVPMILSSILITTEGLILEMHFK
jgi:hypothetical protein